MAVDLNKKGRKMPKYNVIISRPKKGVGNSKSLPGRP